jgi:hypothetical protein
LITTTLRAGPLDDAERAVMHGIGGRRAAEEAVL